MNMAKLTLIGKSWKTHLEIFSKFQFPGHELDRFLENSSTNFCDYLFSFFFKYRAMS